MIKRLEWNKKTASVFAVAAALTIVLVVALNPKEITIAENTTLDPVVWTFQRPANGSVQFVYIDEKLNTAYLSDGLSAMFRIIIGIYCENSTARNGADYVTMGIRINSTATNPNGFIESVYVVFHRDSQPSLVDWIETYFYYENLSLSGFSSGWTSQQAYEKAYVELAGANHPDRTYFKATTEWSLLTPNSQSHQIEVAYEITYYNGTAYKKIIQPFQLRIVGE